MMDPDTARRQFENGGTFLCLDMPEGVEMRCDLYSWKVGPLFKGIKMIPPGLHLISWAAGHEQAGAFFLFRPGEVQTWRWNPANEDLEPILDQTEAERLQQGVRSYGFDSHLGPYPADHAELWARLTYLMSTHVLEVSNIFPGQRISGASSQEETGTSVINTNSVPAFAFVPAKRKIDMDPSVSLAINAIHDNRYNLDGSERARELVETTFQGSWNDMLGQLQLSNIPSLEGLDHWKSAVSMFCTSGSLSRSHPSVTAEFVRLLRRQLERLPEDFFRDELMCESFLRPSLEALFEEMAGCTDGDAPQKDAILLERRLRRLRKVLLERFDVDVRDFAGGIGEDMPVVVHDEETKAAEALPVPVSVPPSQGPPPERMSWMLPPPSMAEQADIGVSTPQQTSVSQ